MQRRRPEGPSGRLWRQVGCQRRHGLGVAAGVVGELDRDGFTRPLWNGSVQLLDRAFSLLPLVKPDEPDTFG